MELRRKKHIGYLVATARKISGLSADRVARECNVTRGRVYQWEKQKFILPKNLPALAAALRMPLEMLIAENGARPNKKNEQCLKLNKAVPAVFSRRDYRRFSSISCYNNGTSAD